MYRLGALLVGAGENLHFVSDHESGVSFLTDPIGMGQGVEPIEKNGKITGYRAEIMLEKATYEELGHGRLCLEGRIL